MADGRSKAVPINRPFQPTRNVPKVSQSLPANYYSTRCPRAPAQRPIEARIKPPTLNLPPSPADFQTKPVLSIRNYTGPALSSSVPPTSNKWLTQGPPFKHFKKRSNLEPIPDSPNRSSDDVAFEPKSLTALCLLSDDRSGKDNRPPIKSAPVPHSKLQTQDTTKGQRPLPYAKHNPEQPSREQMMMKTTEEDGANEPEEDDDDVDVDDLENEMFDMEL